MSECSRGLAPEIILCQPDARSAQLHGHSFSTEVSYLPMSAHTNIAAIDLFCGAGGLTLGLEREGIDVRAAIDLDPSCRHPIEANTGAEFFEADIEELEVSRVEGWLADADYTCISGCAPCQPFSTYTQGKPRRRGDARWRLLDAFATLVTTVLPDFVTMENVPRLRKMPVFRRFLRELECAGYHVASQIVSCVDYGVPQNRKRLVALASRLGEITLVPPTHPQTRRRTLRQAIARLPETDAGAPATHDRMHVAPSLSPVNLSRIRRSTPGGTWREWPDDLVSPCHRTGKFGSKYPSVYGRMTWDAPAPTITTNCFNYGSGRFGHPTQNRAITLREAALLQTFPKSFSFVPQGEAVQFASVGRMIGNAVPPRLGQIIARSISRHAEAASAAWFQPP